MEMFEHFSHPHPLVFHSEGKPDSEEVDLCSGCWEPVLGPSYGCTQCRFSLHKKCAELPCKIDHPLHRRHRLHLLMNFTLQCDLCEKLSQSLVYHCQVCGFSLDIKCADLPPHVIETSSHEHPFSLLCKKINFHCDACGEEGHYFPYVCSLCNLTVHKDCISLPRSIKILRHEHPINHNYFLPGNESYESDLCPCAICHFEVDRDHGCYYCSSCNYVVHALCATRSDIWDGKTELLEDEDEASSDLISDSFTSIDISKTNWEDRVVAREIEHFSHEHTLIFNEEVKDEKRCDGCMLPITTSSYSCEQCSFFLHKTCVDLPRKKAHPFHPHPISLLPQAPCSTGLFCCDACSQYSHGFIYNCKRCNFNLDLRCASIEYSLKHDCHEHPLTAFFNARYAEMCDSCDQIAGNKVKCVDCIYVLDFKCATLPTKATHKYDRHPLILTFQDDWDVETYCEVCEEERDPRHWFYNCAICNFDAHIDCVLGKYPYIKHWEIPAKLMLTLISSLLCRRLETTLPAASVPRLARNWLLNADRLSATLSSTGNVLA